MAAGSASAAWVAGVGGVAGAANAAQLTLNSQGMSATASGQVYTALTEKIRAQLDTLDTLQSGVDGTAFILRLRATCLFTPLPEVTDAPTIAARTEKAIAQEKAEIAELEKKAATLEYEAVKIRVIDRKRQAQRLEEELQAKQLRLDQGVLAEPLSQAASALAVRWRRNSTTRAAPTARARNWPQPPSTSCPALFLTLVSTPRLCREWTISRMRIARIRTLVVIPF